MEDREYKSIIEGMLYLWGDPLAYSDIGEVLGLTVSRVKELCGQMADEFDYYRRGLVVRQYGESVQLTSRQEHAPYFAKLVEEKKETSLSHPAMEALSIIAYKQPVTRLEVDQIRGVKSTASIDTLLKRGLIEEAGRLDQIGRPILYRTSTKFLQAFNLRSLDDLPHLEDIQQMVEAKEAAQAEARSGEGENHADQPLSG